MAQKRIYSFGGGKAEGNKDMKEPSAGRAQGSPRCPTSGSRCPPGFTITTEVCTEYYREREEAPARPRPRAARRAEEGRGAHREGVRRSGEPAPRLGPLRRARLDARDDGHRPQPRPQRRDRRGARGAARNPRFAWDSYRRFVAMFGDVVLGMKPERKEDRDPFEEILERKKHARGVKVRLRAAGGRRCGSSSRSSRPRSAAARASTSPTTRWSSSARRSTRCSGPGRTTAPSPTAG